LCHEDKSSTKHDQL